MEDQLPDHPHHYNVLLGACIDYTTLYVWWAWGTSFRLHNTKDTNIDACLTEQSCMQIHGYFLVALIRLSYTGHAHQQDLALHRYIYEA